MTDLSNKGGIIPGTEEDLIECRVHRDFILTKAQFVKMKELLGDQCPMDETPLTMTVELNSDQIVEKILEAKRKLRCGSVKGAVS